MDFALTLRLIAFSPLLILCRPGSNSGMSEALDPKVWHEVIRATLSAWLCRHFQPCCCEPKSAHLRCHRHVEFLWRKRYKDDLVTQFVRAEPWLQKADRLHLRDMMVTALIAKGFPVLLANTSSSKARVHFPDGTCHRVTGVALNIRRRDLGQGVDSSMWRLGQSIEGSSEQSEYAESLSAHSDSADRYSDNLTGTGLFEVDDGDVIDDDDDDQGAHDGPHEGDDLNEQDLLSAFSATFQDDSFFRRPPPMLPRAGGAAANAAAARRSCASASAGGASRGKLPAAIGWGGGSNLSGLPRMPRQAGSGAFGGFTPDLDLLSDTSWLEDPPRLGSARDLDLLEDPLLVTVADRGDGDSPILAYTVPEARRVLCPTAAAEPNPGRRGTYREVLRDEKRNEDERWRQQRQWQHQQHQRQQQQRRRQQQQQQEEEEVALTSKAAPPTCTPLPAGMTMRDAPAAFGCLPHCVTIPKRASGASSALPLRAMIVATAASSTAAALSTAAIATAAAVAAAAAAASTSGATPTAAPTAACVTPSVVPPATTVAAVAAVTALRATVICSAPSAVICSAPSAVICSAPSAVIGGALSAVICSAPSAVICSAPSAVIGGAPSAVICSAPPAVIGAALSAAGGAAPVISIASTSSLKASASTSDASLILGRVSAAGGDLKALSDLSQLSQSRLLEQLKGLGISKLGERVAAVNFFRSGAPLPPPASSSWTARVSVASATPATESVGASAGLVNRDEGGCKEGGRDEGGCEGGISGTGDTMIVDPPTAACTETMPVLEDGDSESLPDVPDLGPDLGTDLGRIWSQPSLSAQLSSASLPDFLTLWPSPAVPSRPSAPVPPASSAPVSMPGTARPLERKRMRELLIGEVDEGNEGSADDALEGGSDDECCRARDDPGSEGLPSISGRISGSDGLLPMSKWLQPVTAVKVPGSPLLLRPGSSKRRMRGHL